MKYTQKARLKQIPVKRLIVAALYISALALILLGIFNGGMRDVFMKAVNICTECIGLG